MQNLEIRNLTFTFSHGLEQQPLIKDFSLKINAGEFVVILGESGCGKTSLLHLMAGLYEVPKGTLLIDGQTVNGPHPSRILLFQQSRLLPWLTVEQNIGFGCRLRKDEDQLEQRITDQISLMGLGGYEHAFPMELSAGMAHRVAIARALIGNPELLLLDEPFTALDYFNRNRLQQELIDLWHKLGFTAVMVTHDIEEAAKIGQRIVSLSNRPLKIASIEEPESSIPRDLDNPETIALKKRIQNHFHMNNRMGGL